MRIDTSEDIDALLRARPEGYARNTRHGYGIRIRKAYNAQMMALWERSSLIPFSSWDPPRNTRGEPTGPRWSTYYRKVILVDVHTGKLTADEGERLIEYLDILGT